LTISVVLVEISFKTLQL